MPENIASCKVMEKVGMRLYKEGNYNNSNKISNWYEIEKKLP
jgi:RimJ/RimL family protein N-acetyltransferase